MRIRLQLLRSLALMLILVALPSCGGDNDDIPDFPTVVSLGEGGIFPGIMNSSLAVGENRVVWQLIDAADEQVVGAAMHVRYYDLNGEDPVLSTEADARFIEAQTSFIDENNGGESTVTGTAGVYVTYTSFDAPGKWGAELSISHDGEEDVTTFQFNVMDTPIEPAIGDPAPPSMQATTATEPLMEIDSSFPLRPAMHTTTIADALGAAKPIVIVFATPAYCTSRTCAPVLEDAVDPLVERYVNDVTFVHIEPYLLRDLREANVRNPVPAAIEWRLQSEPWVFVAGRDGRIIGKFEGIVAADEVEAAVEAALEGVSAAGTPVGGS